jgi:hypothetical protein
LKTDVGALKTDMGALKTDVRTLTESVNLLQRKQRNEEVRRSNAIKSLSQTLTKFEYNTRGEPWPQDVDQPATFNHLSVSGAEGLPGNPGVKSGWNKEKSRKFLTQAILGYTTDSEGEDENGPRARTRRLKVIDALGGQHERVVAQVYNY